jgi:hypothetical protein
LPTHCRDAQRKGIYKPSDRATSFGFRVALVGDLKAKAPAAKVGSVHLPAGVPETDFATLQGTWEIESVDLDGMAFDLVKGLRLRPTVTGDKVRCMPPPGMATAAAALEAITGWKSQNPKDGSPVEGAFQIDDSKAARATGPTNLPSPVTPSHSRTGIPARDGKSFVPTVYIHDLKIDLAGLRAVFDMDTTAKATLFGYWGTVLAWTEHSRYEDKIEAAARELYEAIISSPDGVLTWIKRYW